MWHMDWSIKRVGISCVLKVTPSKLVFIKLNFTSRKPNFRYFLKRAVVYLKPPAHLINASVGEVVHTAE